MGRSTETFNKKEREKKKLKKQQDKREKAEDRKAVNGKGKSLDDMMAYVDENGNLTSVPPSQSKRGEIAVENIQIATPKAVDVFVETVRNGVVSSFNNSKGFGFIKDLQTQESIFVHANGLLQQISEGDKVTFETQQGQKGLNAVKVSKVNK